MTGKITVEEFQKAWTEEITKRTWAYHWEGADAYNELKGTGYLDFVLPSQEIGDYRLNFLLPVCRGKSIITADCPGKSAPLTDALTTFWSY